MARARNPQYVLIGDLTIEYMKREGCFSLMWLDGAMADLAAKAGVTVAHPLNKMEVTARALRGDDRFVKHRTHGMDCNGRSRIVTSYWLREDLRD